MAGTFFYFILALFLLVIVHEYGHFIVARRCGVKVLRFSFGFGKVLAAFRDKRGTEYAWSLFPLGGYVKMLNEEDEPVANAEKHLAFNNQSVWARIAIVIAGPIFNFLFAWFAFWLVLVVGINALAPMIDKVIPGSIADRAGITAQQEIIRLNGQDINSWRDVQYSLMPLLGSIENVSVTLRSMRDHSVSTLSLPLAQWQLDNKTEDLLTGLGIRPFIPAIPPIVATITPGSPAQLAGFQIADKVVAVNGNPISDWLELLDTVQKSPHKLINLRIQRNGHELTVPVKLGAVQQHGQWVGKLGVMSKPMDWPKGWRRTQRENPFLAIITSFKQTTQIIGATFTLIGRLIIGKISLQGVSGPVGIAQGAGQSARSGFAYYMVFLGLISISLGVLNLLPIPLLDGGHLLYYVLEIIFRRPISLQTKSVGMSIGFMVLMAIMGLALVNDLSRLMK